MKKIQELNKAEMEQVSGGFNDFLWGLVFNIGERILGKVLQSFAGYLSRR